MKTVIFDLDGTLIESHEDVWDSIQLAFEFIGCNFPLNLRQDNMLLSLSPIEILHKAYPEVSPADANRFLVELRRLYTEVCDYHKTRLYPGIERLLHQLHIIRFTLFIATMKSKRCTESILRTKKMESHFTAVFSPDSLPGQRIEKWEMLNYILKRYTMEAKDCLMVGDTGTDLMAAQRIGIPAIGVTWGYGQLLDLSSLRPVMLASSVDELTGYLLAHRG